MRWFWVCLAILGLISAAGYGWLVISSNANATPAVVPITTTSNKQTNPEPIIQPQIKYPAVAKVEVPVLMYHYIRDYQNTNDNLGIQLSVSPAMLDKQLTILEKAGYHTISLTDFGKGNYGSSKPIILTFDDGYDDHYSAALPLLQKHQMTATFFIVSGFIGRPGYMTAGQINELKAAGMELGGHTITHLDLATAPYNKQYTEISTSMIGRSSVFAYPSGKYNAITLQIMQLLGVKVAVTTNFGLATDQSPLLELPRIRVKQNLDLLKTIADETAKLKKVEITPSNSDSSAVKSTQ